MNTKYKKIKRIGILFILFGILLFSGTIYCLFKPDSSFIVHFIKENTLVILLIEIFISLIGIIIIKVLSAIKEKDNSCNEYPVDGFYTYKYDDGGYYSGHWKNGLYNGQGILAYADGKKFEGVFVNGTMNGHGVLTDSDGYRCECEWKDGKQNGYGKLITSKGTRYEGEWKNGEFHGHGILVTSDGENYEGEWYYGKRNGYGIYQYRNLKYEGGWKNDKNHGHGIIYFEDGSSLEGEFINDNLQGVAIRTQSDGKQIKEIWRNGELISEQIIEDNQEQITKNKTGVTSNSSIYNERIINTINEIIKKYGTECFKKGGTAINIIADYFPNNEDSKLRRRIKNAVDSGVCNYLLENSSNKEERIRRAVSNLMDYCDMDEEIAVETVNLLANVLK